MHVNIARRTVQPFRSQVSTQRKALNLQNSSTTQDSNQYHPLSMGHNQTAELPNHRKNPSNIKTINSIQYLSTKLTYYHPINPPDAECQVPSGGRQYTSFKRTLQTKHRDTYAFFSG
ncbi:hypothetical protein V3481_014488 [Fusarium oxysporum f. sp. vasinfectum]